MARLRFLTAGESHGPGLTAILEGIPAGLPLTPADVNTDLARRQSGYGRGGRMKIEKDRVEFTSGLRWGETMGSPLSLWVANRDYVNWTEKMSVNAEDRDPSIIISRPRPGHADLVGVLKYDREDIRDILERSSARETTVRVAVGAVCRRLLAEFGIDLLSHVVRIGQTPAPELPLYPNLAEVREQVEASPVRCADAEASQAMVAEIDQAMADEDTLGGVLELVVTGLPIGLGSHVQWDRKLDGRIAGALMSVQAMKGVEFGSGFAMTTRPGSAVHDEILSVESSSDKPSDQSSGGLVTKRNRNNAGGLEGGMTDGMPLVVRVAMKPIATVKKGLSSVDLKTGQASRSTYQRSDVTAVPAAGVVLEAVLAYVLADAFLEKFGGDSLREVASNYRNYLKQIERARIFEGETAGERQDSY